MSTPRQFKRSLLLILDSVGVGAMPDAADFGDQGSDTLGHLAASRLLNLPNMSRLGLGNIRPLQDIPPVDRPIGFFGKAALASRGKDTTSGHWEMMGIILDHPFPTYPDGFPDEIVSAFEKAIGRKVIGNYPASGTEIVQDLGEEHIRTGSPILYTSADSVFQLAAHIDVIPLAELYRFCQLARDLLQGEHQVGRVIARPFRGRPSHFERTTDRKDFAIPPPSPTVLDALDQAEIPVIAIGKIGSIYCQRGITTELESRDNRHTFSQTMQVVEELDEGLVFANFIDFDMLYGHRNDPAGYADALEEFDRMLERLLERLRQDDLLILASDHGCDPTTPSTDHSREYALLLCCSPACQPGHSLGTRESL
ncbi:MAG TPA: phosphopentomutase, partial [Acidobacteriota bacterium]|nr:phosphopentomutase [Acidobacteriota bacterium]